MPEEQFIKLSRDLLYSEIWEISVSGVAKKYNIPYAELLRLCKEIEVPIPPSGYWTKQRLGKSVVQIPLPEFTHSEVILPTSVEPKRSAKSEAVNVKIEEDKRLKINGLEDETQTKDRERQPEGEAAVENNESQVAYRIVEGKYNTYNREKLYEEVWSKPVVQVAVQYGVSDVAIHKVCKSLNVPVPPRGYWARIRSGEKIKRPPLPPTKGIIQKTGTKTFEGFKEPIAPQQTLAFLSVEERQKVLLAAEQIRLYDENARLHNKIRAYQSTVKEWNKNDRRPEGSQKGLKNYFNRPPFLAGVISNETLPRVYRILDALYRQVESLGGSVNDDLSLIIRNEHVTLDISEAQDEVKHEITREEAQALIKYEDVKRHNSYWASQPNIRKYDYVFNGKLRICVRQNRYFKDSDKSNVESRLGEMLIEIYEQSEVIKQKRLAAEEAERRRQEEERQREERRVRYNDEVEKTIALMNIVQDYDMACKIRTFVAALESSEDTDEKTAAFITWAKKKADWFDPSVARTDEILGDRDHEESEDRKSLKKRYY